MELQDSPSPTTSQSLPLLPTTTDKPTTRRRPRGTKPRPLKGQITWRSATQSSPSSLSHPVQPYPANNFRMMNGAYPMNGSPFTQQPHPAYTSQATVNGASGPGMPGPPQYGYPMHPSPYPPPGYNPYAQYPQQMVMYGPPRPTSSPEATHSVPTPDPVSAQPSAKRKRKSAVLDEKVSEDETVTSGRVMTPAQAVAHQSNATSPVDIKKRTKTQRACDSCRSRKIRCDYLAEGDSPICQHCKQYGFECTSFLPITETRFKKKKLDEEAANNQDSKEKSTNQRRTSSPQTDSKGEPRLSVYGPTSATHLLHSQATISSRVYENYDLRYHHTWEVSQNGDGLITVQKPAGDEQQLSLPKPVDLRLERDVIEKLVNAYFTDVAPILPVVTQAEFISNPSPPPILLYSMCLVAAGRREVPQGVFDSFRYAVNTVIKADDVLSTASIVNVQALLILCMMGDCHSQYVPTALSALWIRLGTAIRMAQDLGLHRAESVKQNIELRRRLWGACLISDRWTSLTYGHPYMIDIQDCDARLPSSGDPNDRYMDELVRLSVLLGRVLKTIYSPSGLAFTTDDALTSLLEDIESWKRNLPEDLQFKNSETDRNAGLLHLLYSCVCMIFWRVFMRISYTCPAHLQFSLTVEKWNELVKLTGDAIDWLDAHEGLYDVWLLVAYAATSCALIQYHTWARRKDADAAVKLRTLRDCVRRWEASIYADHMSARRKTAEIISLLYEATQGPPVPLETPALNPTGGVQGKQLLGSLVYKQDPSRPGGGVFVAHGQAKDRFNDLPEGAIINSSSDDEAEADALGKAGTSSDLPSDRRNRGVILSPSIFAPLLPAQPPSPSTRSPMASATPRGANGASSTPPGGSMVNITPLGGGNGRRNSTNVNPAMNVKTQAPENVQVMNVLDVPQASGTLQQFAMADTGLLEGIPGGMFDWGQWDTFFSRFSGSAVEGSGGDGMVAPQHEASEHSNSLKT